MTFLSIPGYKNNKENLLNVYFSLFHKIERSIKKTRRSTVVILNHYKDMIQIVLSPSYNE